MDKQRFEAGMASIKKRALAAPKPAKQRKFKRLNVRLEQRELGKWWAIAGDGNGVLATDYEINLWMDLQEIRALLKLKE